MGLDAEVRAACTDTAGAYTVDADGNVLETFRAEDDDGDGYISEIEVLRGDFSQVLYDDTRDSVEYVFGDRIAELTQDADGVDVTFASGDRRRFELVIGADGLHSALRAMVFGPREQFVRHLGLVLAFYTVPNEFGLDRWLLDYQEGGRWAGLRPVPDATRAIAMLSFPAPGFDIDYRDIEAQQRLLREKMAGFGWETQRILAHLDDTPDFYLDQVAQVVMDRWSSGRVGLLGDAAFSASPMSGAGTGLALVGAYMLAGELAAADWDPAAGFAGYEERMRSYVEANQEIGRMHVQMLAARTRTPSRARSPTWRPSPPWSSAGQRPRAARLRRRARLRHPAGTFVGLGRARRRRKADRLKLMSGRLQPRSRSGALTLWRCRCADGSRSRSGLGRASSGSSARRT